MQTCVLCTDFAPRQVAIGVYRNMRLLDTQTGQFVEKDPANTQYAILSHTWDNIKGEQTYNQLATIQQRYASTEPQHPYGRSRDPRHALQVSSDLDLPDLSPTSPVASSSRRKSLSSFRSVGVPTSQVANERTPLPSDTPGDRTDLVEQGISPENHHKQSRCRRLRQHALLTFTSLGHFVKSLHKRLVSEPSPTKDSEGQAERPPCSIWEDPELSPKIHDACAVARAYGYRYLWIDSCCIDKSSSSELSEAINSMYLWYASADICYAYLADVPAGDDHWRDGSHFRKSRWFTRGWTLQELIAPLHVEFLCQDWAGIGSKHILIDLIESVTGISYEALLHLDPLDKFSVSQRLSWAAKRETTRVEDRAYSLLGIFNINMPTLYGEGSLAFRRLQEQIMQRIPDQSLFAWGFVDLQGTRTFLQLLGALETGDHVEYWESIDHSSPLAIQPSLFEYSGSITTVAHDTVGNIIHFQGPRHHGIEYTSTPYGIRTQFLMVPLSRYFGMSWNSKRYSGEAMENSSWYLAILGCEHKAHPGFLLGRFCYTKPSSSGIELLCPGTMRVTTWHESTNFATDLFPLSPSRLKGCHPDIQLKTVYMAHPSPAAIRVPYFQPYKTINLVLLRETWDALLAQGYTADLRRPNRDHPVTHRLTLSNPTHNIVVAFRHTLAQEGKRFTLDAEVSLTETSVSESRAPALDPIPKSDSPTNCQARSDPTITTVSWTDAISWYSGLKHERVSLVLDAASGSALTVDLSLEFAGTGAYFLHVDVCHAEVRDVAYQAASRGRWPRIRDAPRTPTFPMLELPPVDLTIVTASEDRNRLAAAVHTNTGQIITKRA